MTPFFRASLLIGLLTLGARETLAVEPRTLVPAQTDAPAPNASARHVAGPAPELQGLMLFGSAAVALMFLCRGYQKETPHLVCGTGVFAMMASVYGFMTGAWPLGIALGVYSIASLRGALQLRHGSQRATGGVMKCKATPLFEESRMSRLFGNSN